MVEISRYEANRKVRTILVRHVVDLSRLQFSCSDHVIHLYGELHREDRTPMTAAFVETIAREIQAVSPLHQPRWDINNWNIRSEYGSISARPKTQVVSGSQDERVRQFNLDELDDK